MDSSAGNAARKRHEVSPGPANLDYVVLGQVKRDQDRVRVIAHLIRVSDQAHMWATTFDRPVFTLDVQSELAEAIANAVAARLRR